MAAMCCSSCVQAMVKLLHWFGFVCIRIPLAILCWILPAPSAPPRRLSEKRRPGSLSSLPEPQPLPTKLAGLTIGFSGCANLCFYCLGALACLQAAQAKQHESILGSVKFAGVSAGGIIAVLGALGIDVKDVFLPKAFSAMEDDLRKVVGIPMCGSLRWCTTVFLPLLAKMLADAGDQAFRRVGGACSIGVTTFSPGITATTISEFASNDDLINVVTATCMAPVVFPMVYTTIEPYGVGMDGAVACEFVECDVKVSPFASDKAEIGVDVDYDNARVRQIGLLNHEDLLLLYQDGYLKCLEWLNSVAM